MKGVVLAVAISNYALSSGRDRHTSGFSHGEQQATIDFQNNSPFNLVCVEHTSYYCAGYFKGYNVTWNNLTTNRQTSNPNSPASNSTNPLSTNTNTIAADSHTIISASTDSWVGPSIIFVIIVVIILQRVR
jgi:hypothetical protein